MSTTFCFVTKHNNVTNTEIKKIETEFEKNNFEVIDQTRLGVDGVVLKIRNFLPKDFTYLEKTLELDINFSVKAIEIKQLLLADMDSTIISSECIDELAEYAGVRAEVTLITEKAMAGEMDFMEALQQRVKLLRGLTVQQLTDCYNKKIHLNKGVRTLVKTMNSLGSASSIVSGGFSFFADKIANDTGFDQAYANHLVFEGNMLSGTVTKPIMGAAEKQKVLQNLCVERNIDLCDVIAVGDGANDIDMIRIAGIGVSYYGKMKLTEESDFKIYYSNLRALLYFQGIKESDFATE
jgi:phosphoserine phosphatase